MTDAVNSGAHTPFGVGSVVGDSFSILFKKLPAVALLGFVPALVDVTLNNALTNQTAANFEPGAEFDTGTYLIGFGVTFLVSLVMMAIITATLVQLSYDAKLGRPTQIGRYFAAAIRNLPAIVVLSFVTSILYVIGAMLLIIPGLWVYAVFSVIVPVIVIEGAGFGAMGRSAELTKDYRWPIVGTIFLITICVMLIAIVGAFITSALSGGFSGVGSTGPWIIFEAVVNAISYGLLSISVALIFARLKEIKEGASVSDLVDVFK